MRTPGLGLGLDSGVGRGFSPSNIPGLLQYVDATRQVTIATGVSNWADQSGNGNAFLQASPSLQPAFNASDAKFNGKPSVGFTVAGGGQYIRAPYSIPAVNTVLLVTYQNPTNAGGADYSYDSGGVANHRIGAISGGAFMYAGTLITSAAGFDTNAHCIVAVWNGASSALYVDSSTVGVVTGNPGDSSIALNAYIGLGFTGTGAIGVRMNFSGALTAAQVSYLMKGLSAQNWGGPWV